MLICLIKYPLSSSILIIKLAVITPNWMHDLCVSAPVSYQRRAAYTFIHSHQSYKDLVPPIQGQWFPSEKGADNCHLLPATQIRSESSVCAGMKNNHSSVEQKVVTQQLMKCQNEASRKEWLSKSMKWTRKKKGKYFIYFWGLTIIRFLTFFICSCQFSPAE